MPYLRHSSPADNPAACSFSTLMICSSVNLLLRMSVSLGNGLYPKTGAFKGSRSCRTFHRAEKRAPILPNCTSKALLLCWTHALIVQHSVPLSPRTKQD